MRQRVFSGNAKTSAEFLACASALKSIVPSAKDALSKLRAAITGPAKSATVRPTPAERAAPVVPTVAPTDATINVDSILASKIAQERARFSPDGSAVAVA